MPEWFTNAFGAIAQEIADGIVDGRDKVLFEGFFNLRTAEPHQGIDLGWTLKDDKAPVKANEPPSHEEEHGIDR